MILFFGSGSQTVRLGPCGSEYCSNCNAQRNFDMHFFYDYVVIQLAFGYLRDWGYFAHCQTCGIGTRLELNQVNPQYRNIRIPFMLRYGWIVLILLIIAMVGFLFWLGNYASRRRAGLPPNVQAPGPRSETPPVARTFMSAASRRIFEAQEMRVRAQRLAATSFTPARSERMPATNEDTTSPSKCPVFLAPDDATTWTVCSYAA